VIPDSGSVPRALPHCVFCDSPIKAQRRAMLTVLVDRHIFRRCAHLGCLRTFERRQEWKIVSILEYSVGDPFHVALHEARA
jgi:hypothetical protein